MIRRGQYRFLGYDKAARQPNIVVDGRGNPQTALTLSHWPKSGTPWELKGDSSVEVVFNYLDRPAFHVDVEAVTNDHFDEDGLIGLWCLIEPEAAAPHRELLIDASHAGDFDTYRDRRAARLAFAIARLANPRLSPWGEETFARPGIDGTEATYDLLLGLIGDLVEDLEGHRHLWEEEDELLSASEKAVADGEATIEEDPALDLAVVRVDAGWPERIGSRLLKQRAIVIHPMAIHNRTTCNRIATICGDRYRFGYRYESWVQMVTSRPPPRIDLTPLAEELSARDGRAWRFDGVSQITPKLRGLGGRNTLDEATFLDALRRALATGEAAWDPYDAADAA